jgi:hypothetical protein
MSRSENYLRTCHRTSITPMLTARAVYQSCLSWIQLPFSIVVVFLGLIYPLLVAAFAIIRLMGQIYSFTSEFLSIQSPDAKILDALRYLNMSTYFFHGGSFVVGIALAIFFITATLIIGPVIFVSLKAAYDDLVWGILIFLAIMIAIVLRPAVPAIFTLYRDTANDRTMTMNDILNSLTPRDVVNSVIMATAAALVGLHLVCAIAMRAFRLPRLSAAAPRIGVRDIIGKYIGQRWGRLWAELSAIIRALRASMVRAIVFAAAVSAFLVSWSFLFGQSSASTYPMPFLVAFSPLLVAFCVAEVATLWRLFSQPDMRFMNAVFMIFLLPNIPFGTLLAIDSGPITPDLVSNIGGAMTMLMAIQMRGYLLAPLREAFLHFRRNLIRTAAEIAADAKKRPILLLRAFADDQARVRASFRFFLFAFGSRGAKTPLEEVIAEALFARGPVIALSNPRAKHPAPLGAARDESADEAWQDNVLHRIDGTQLVVVVIGRTANLSWEVDQLVGRGALTRTIFVAPPGYPSDRTLSAVSAVAAQAMGLDARAEAELGRRVRVICFDQRRGRWTALTSLFANERAYVEAVRIGAGLGLDR